MGTLTASGEEGRVRKLQSDLSDTAHFGACETTAYFTASFQDDLFPTQIRCPSCRFLSGHGQLVVLDGAAAVDLVFDMATSTTCFRPVPDNVSLGWPWMAYFEVTKFKFSCAISSLRVDPCLPLDTYGQFNSMTLIWRHESAIPATAGLLVLFLRPKVGLIE